MADDFRSDDPGQLVSAPLEALIVGIARSVADAQRQMDAQTAASLIELGLGSDARLEQLRRLGHQPTWFRIPEADAELRVALTLHGEHTDDGSDARLYAAPADASFTNRYAYDLTAASTVKFKVVAVPAPPQALDMVVVPRLYNKRFSDATQVLEERGIPWTVDGKVPQRGDPRVRGTDPRPGELIARGTTLTLKLGGR